MANPTLLSNYTNTDKPVDQAIVGNDFTNSARVVIWAKPYGNADEQFKAIGVVQGWSFTEQKQMEELYELGSDYKYIIPGRTTGSIAITRMLVNGPDLVNALYGEDETKVITSLKYINKPVDIMFTSYHNSQVGADADKAGMVRQFANCWIVAQQESITANQVVIASNCTMVYERIVA